MGGFFPLVTHESLLVNRHFLGSKSARHTTGRGYPALQLLAQEGIMNLLNEAQYDTANSETGIVVDQNPVPPAVHIPQMSILDAIDPGSNDKLPNNNTKSNHHRNRGV